MASEPTPPDPRVEPGRATERRRRDGERPTSLPLTPRLEAGGRWRTALAIAGMASPIVVATAGPFAGAVSAQVPLAAFDLSLSFTRMLSAYALSLGFSLTYGYFAASFRPAERVLIPILDILQSIPILGFFPIVIVLLVGAFGKGSFVGPNLASIFLIFTSMSWNMVFGVYESLKATPNDLREASDSFALHGWRRFRRLLLPATVNRLVYNSVLSWTAGWYFLVAAEFIASGSTNTSIALPGIGSYLLTAAGNGDAASLVAGIALLIALIAALDVFVWRPLGRWAERFRYDQVPSGEGDGAIVTTSSRAAPIRRAAGFVYRGVVTGVSRLSSPLVGLAAFATAPVRTRPAWPMYRKAGNYVALGIVMVLGWLLLIYLGVSVYDTFSSPISGAVRGQIEQLPLAVTFSFGRLLLAYGLSLGIAVGLGIFLIQRPKAYRIGLPIVEVVASVPATALFPLFIFALLPFIGFQGAAILMLITGMVWYLFFNVLSGLRAIPPDLQEAARSYGFPRKTLYRRLVFPAIFPALITGSITAFGGGWNTLIIAEYLRYGSAHSFQVLGVGALIDQGNAEAGGLPLMAAALFTMVVVVVAVNELLWKPLYRRAVEKYRYD